MGGPAQFSMLDQQSKFPLQVPIICPRHVRGQKYPVAGFSDISYFRFLVMLPRCRGHTMGNIYTDGLALTADSTQQPPLVLSSICLLVVNR